MLMPHTDEMRKPCALVDASLPGAAMDIVYACRKYAIIIRRLLYIKAGRAGAAADDAMLPARVIADYCAAI